MVKKFWWYVYSFWQNSRTWQTDTHTHTHTHRERETPHDGIGRACIASRGNKINDIKLSHSWLTHCQRRWHVTDKSRWLVTRHPFMPVWISLWICVVDHRLVTESRVRCVKNAREMNGVIRWRLASQKPRWRSTWRSHLAAVYEQNIVVTITWTTAGCHYASCRNWCAKWL